MSAGRPAGWTAERRGRRQRRDEGEPLAPQEPRGAVGVVRGPDGARHEPGPPRAVLEDGVVDRPLRLGGNAADEREVGLGNPRRPGVVGGAEGLLAAGQEEEAGGDPVEAVDEVEVVPQRPPRLLEEAAEAVRVLSRLLVEGEVLLRARRDGERAERHAARLRKRSAERMTARFPARFAAIPRTISRRPKRTP